HSDQGANIKIRFEALKRRTSSDVVLCLSRDDPHQDHRGVSMLTWNTPALQVSGSEAARAHRMHRIEHRSWRYSFRETNGAGNMSCRLKAAAANGVIARFYGVLDRSA